MPQIMVTYTDKMPPRMAQMGRMREDRYQLDDRIEMAMQLKMADLRYQAEFKRPMPPNERYFAVQEILYRHIYGMAPRDLMAGAVLGGANAGRRIEKAAFSLKDKEPLSFEAELSKERLTDQEIRDIQFAAGTGSSTRGGNAAGDVAPVYSPLDAGVYGGTTGIVPPMFLNEMLSLYSRGLQIPPFVRVGIMSGFVARVPLRTNSVATQLFDDDAEPTQTPASGKDAIRAEGATGTVFLRPTYDKFDTVCMGRMIHSEATGEELRSVENLLLGIEADALSDLALAPAMLNQYDSWQALITALDLGYMRRWISGSFNVATTEIPFGKVKVIDAAAANHVRFFDTKRGTFYAPASAHADYRKYHAASLDTTLFPEQGNKFLEAVAVLDWLQYLKGRRLDFVICPKSLAITLDFDDRIKNSLFNYGPGLTSADLGGFVGQLLLQGRMIDIFVPERGGAPKVTTADTSAITLDGLMIGGERGKAVNLYPLWPLTIVRNPEMTTASITGADGSTAKTVALPTMAEIISAFSIESNEALDAMSCSMLKCTTVAKQAA